MSTGMVAFQFGAIRAKVVCFASTPLQHIICYKVCDFLQVFLLVRFLANVHQCQKIIRGPCKFRQHDIVTILMLYWSQSIVMSSIMLSIQVWRFASRIWLFFPS